MKEKLKKIVLNWYLGPDGLEKYIIVLEMTGGRSLIEIPAGSDATEIYLKLEELGEQVAGAVKKRNGGAKPNVANCNPESP